MMRALVLSRIEVSWSVAVLGASVVTSHNFTEAHCCVKSCRISSLIISDAPPPNTISFDMLLSCVQCRNTFAASWTGIRNKSVDDLIALQHSENALPLSLLNELFPQLKGTINA